MEPPTTSIGQSRSGLKTKILTVPDALGHFVKIILLPGQRYDTIGVAPLITSIEFNGLIAGKAFDAH